MSCIICGKSFNRIEATIKDKNSEKTYCPNCLIGEFIEGNLNLENDLNLIDDITGEHGAVEYKSDHESYTLERETMLRLIAHDLDCDEYFALAKKYGADMFHLHDDFYDPDTGEAEQPVLIFEED